MTLPSVCTFAEALGNDFPDAYSPLYPQREVAYTHEFLHITASETLRQTKLSRFALAQEYSLHLPSTWHLVGNDGFMLSPKGELIKDAFSFPDEREILRHWMQAKPWEIQRHQHLDELVFPFTNVGYRNYYHVMAELLPRLVLIRQHFPEAHILVMEDSPSFVWEAFKRIGLSSKLVILQRKGVAYSARTWVTIPWALNFISERFAMLKASMNLVHGLSSPKQRLYISRAKAGSRTLLNEADVLPLVQSYGFTVLETENMSFAQQVELFSSATCICAPHGAGLTNMLWMKHPNVIEIRPAGWDNRCFYHLALSNGATQYTIVDAQAQTPQLDMLLEIDHLHQALEDAVIQGRL